MKNVTILALENTLASTVTGPLDIFSQAGVLWNAISGSAPEPFFRVRIASLDGRPVRCHGGLVIEPHDALADVGPTDLVVVSYEDLSALDATSRRTTPWLRERFAAGAWIASICTGAFLLAESGLLDDRRATTHWGWAEAFRRRYPRVDLRLECLLTEDEGMFCSGGAHSYFDLCLYLIERIRGYEVAVQTAKSLLLDLGRGSQTDYAVFDFQKKHQDAAVLKAQEWIEKHHPDGG